MPTPTLKRLNSYSNSRVHRPHKCVVLSCAYYTIASSIHKLLIYKFRTPQFLLVIAVQVAHLAVDRSFSHTLLSTTVHCGQRGMKLQAVVVLLELTVLLSQQMPPCEGFKVAAFNIQKFGDQKIQDSAFTTALANVRTYECECVHMCVCTHMCSVCAGVCMYIIVRMHVNVCVTDDRLLAIEICRPREFIIQ